ncbi:MAG: hypothetical protein GY874_07980, partial [Desulfobacteraceae bacterium]|nr:hypothetical protein [Desulfobacteraceae bacterium]
NVNKQNVKNVNTQTVLIHCPPPEEAISHVFELPSTKKTIAYFHAAAGFPTKETWIKAIRNGNYDTWPGLTEEAVNKYYPESDETQKGHMKGQRQGLRSTTDAPPKPTQPPKKRHETFMKVIDMRETMYTDQTGKFPYLSSRGNQYQMVVYHSDANYIFAKPLKNRTKGQIIEAYNRIIKRMKKGGLSVKKHILDNKISENFKSTIEEHGAEYELVPPGEHRRNIAERAIQTWKNHFVGVLAELHALFPMHLWCRIIPQAEMQLNLLRNSTITPNISAW